ncbi:MAG: outer-membrane lipoprotein carrier protein LolA [Deltaproteobacteria bacterium]|nr:outer-membrane lipoprotein carrier protein LolA [Deltaproteobacteria bacterium]
MRELRQLFRPGAGPRAAGSGPLSRAVILFCLLSAGLVLPAARPALAVGDSRAVEEALAGLAERYQGMGSFSADYERTTFSPASDGVFKAQATQTAEGVLEYLAATSLRLDQKKPAVEVMSTDGTTAWWYLKKQNQVHVYRDLDLAGGLSPLLSFLSGLDALREKYLIGPPEAADVREGTTGLVLRDRSDPGGGDYVVVYCGGGHELSGFRLVSMTGEKTDFFLKNQRVNPGFPGERFVFTPPGGTAVIEETEG